MQISGLEARETLLKAAALKAQGEVEARAEEIADNSEKVVNVANSESPVIPPAKPPRHGQLYTSKEDERLNQASPPQYARVAPHEKRLQVFISSTYVDLREERQAAVAAILTAGHIPAGMELFTAGDESQMEVIKRWIDESDVFMLILGSRYGSIEPTTGKSYTHIEYDYAVANGKPIFATVLDDGALDERIRHMGTIVVESQDPRALSAFREQICKRTVRFWTDLKDIKLTVHETMTEFAKREDLRGWVRAPNDVDARSLVAADASSRLTEMKGTSASAESAVVSRNSKNVEVAGCDTDESFEVTDASCEFSRGPRTSSAGYQLVLKNLSERPLRCSVTLQFLGKDGKGVVRRADYPPGTIQSYEVGSIGASIGSIKNADADLITQVVIAVKRKR